MELCPDALGTMISNPVLGPVVTARPVVSDSKVAEVNRDVCPGSPWATTEAE
jgi:hypothetical protein